MPFRLFPLRAWTACLLLLLLGQGLTIPAAEAAIVALSTLETANYRDDFSGSTLPAGWQYLWNQPSGWTASGDFGDGTSHAIESGFADFAPLQWSSANNSWTPDGDNNNSNNPPANFAKLTATGGHPGIGYSQSGGGNNSRDRYVIAAYTVTQGGEYALGDSSLDQATTLNDVNTRVFVNTGGNEIGGAVVSSGEPVSFNRSLGNLASGDTVYVAAGPNGHASGDHFSWDFTIEQTKFDLSGDQTQSNTEIRLIQEQTLTLAADLTVDRANPDGLSGTVGPNASFGSESIAAGTSVTSYLLHLDPFTDSTVSGNVTFDQDIVGLIFLSGKLDATDDLLGLSDIIYPSDAGAQTTRFRGGLNEGVDQLIISADRRTIDLTLFAGAGGSVDQIRVLTAPSVPEPASLVLWLAMGLGCAIYCRFRRPSFQGS